MKKRGQNRLKKLFEVDIQTLKENNQKIIELSVALNKQIRTAEKQRRKMVKDISVEIWASLDLSTEEMHFLALKTPAKKDVLADMLERTDYIVPYIAKYNGKNRHVSLNKHSVDAAIKFVNFKSFLNRINKEFATQSLRIHLEGENKSRYAISLYQTNQA